MNKEDLDIEIQNDALVVRGEKRFERENTEGRYRVLQCAYGSFRRVVPLPVAVLSDKASATYRYCESSCPRRKPTGLAS